jgi:hypothetical protein
MLITIIDKLKRDFPDLRVTQHFGEYELYLARDGMILKMTLTNMNPLNGYVYANYLSVEVTRENGIIKATYYDGSTDFLLNSGDVMYSYEYKKNKTKPLEISQQQLYSFFRGDVIQWINLHTKMKFKGDPYGWLADLFKISSKVEELVIKLVRGE